MPIKFVKGMGKSKRALTFGDLNRGDIFQTEYGTWCIVTSNIFDDCGDLTGNAITLDGDIMLFGDDQCVTKLKKDLVIEYSNDDITEWYE